VGWRQDVQGRCPGECCNAPALAGDPAVPSLAAGAIGRGLADATNRYRQQLDELWAEVVEALPDD
jgi:hypothetical protein